MPPTFTAASTARPSIHAFSKADSVAGQGVGSAYLEQVGLIASELSDQFDVVPRARAFNFGSINHFHSINPELRAQIPFAGRCGATVGHVHFIPETVDDSISLPRPARAAFYRYMLNFYRATDHLVTVNPWFITALEQEYGFDPSRITFIPNFVSDAQFHPLSSEDPGVLARRESWGAEAGQRVIMCAGQLQTRKGFFDLLEVARALPDMLFVWAGDFSFGRITSGYEQIREARENLPANVRLIGLVPREEMNECFNAADVFFLPSYEELFPMTILEAMSAGTPIVVRDLVYYEGVLFDYATRVQAARGEIEPFVDALSALASDPARYEDAVAAARRGSERYSRGHVAGMWREYYTSLLR
ncbi:MAG: glycosyltransferase family 4 protein [Dermabacter sp.]|nr:glycosyltransferase family 4 protein [Dermabacter sp.]